MPNPTVDILMATYNGERYVAEQIESIQRQTYGNWRLLISDDCSTDCTLDVVRSYAAADPRIRVVSEGVRLGGAKEYFFALMGLIQAPFFMFSDQDDVWLPSKVEKCLAKMQQLEAERDSEVPLLVFTDMKVVNEGLCVVAESFERYENLNPDRTALKQVLAQAVGAGCTFLANRLVASLATRCEDVSAVAMHDWWVTLVAASFGQIGYIDEPLSLYRQHGDNEVGANRFSPATWVGKFGNMVAREGIVAAQAGCFLDTFCSELDIDQKVSCACLAGSMGADGAANVVRLFASGSWKVGTRKLGQLLVSVRGGVVAIVVCYRPDLERLSENLDAIAPQVAAVIAYSNDASATAELPSLLAKHGCIWCEDSANEGLAKALNHTCETAAMLGASYVLLLDQDSVSSEGMVEGLLDCMAEGVGIVSPQIVDRNKLEGASDDISVKSIKRAITSGALVSLAAWRAVGGFDERLFVDWVDYEFSCNLRSHGWRLLRNNQVHLLHEMGHREYAFSTPGLHGRRAWYRTNHAKSRLRDKARSWTITLDKYRGTKAGHEEARYIRAIKIRDLVLERDRMGTLRAFHEGKREGLKALASEGRGV